MEEPVRRDVPIYYSLLLHFVLLVRSGREKKEKPSAVVFRRAKRASANELLIYAMNNAAR